MAANISSSSFILLFLLVLFSCLQKSHAHSLRGANSMDQKLHFHDLKLSSLSPSSICTHSNVPRTRKSTVEIFHKHGPCSSSSVPHHQPSESSLRQILSNDQSRVQYLNNRHRSSLSAAADAYLSDGKLRLTAKSGALLDAGNYFVTVGLGTPVRTLSLMFDTGSALTWTQCEPCVESCYGQHEPLFDPSTSASYSNVSCDSDQCSQLSDATGRDPSCDSASATCIYGIQYGDKSYTVGYLSQDKLTLSTADVVPAFFFGCGQNNGGQFGSTAGLLGLGQANLSLISQTESSYGKVFSYCLPSSSSSTGHLTFGDSGRLSNVKYTPFDLSRGTTFYYVTVKGISVGGRQLAVSPTAFQKPGTIIDSGTVITRLPPDVYSELRSTFKQLMNLKYENAPAYSILDTCFRIGSDAEIQVPKITFTFAGGLVLELPPSGMLLQVGEMQACLPFAGNSDASEIAIWGNTQHKMYEVVYDVAAGKLGIGPGQCT